MAFKKVYLGAMGPWQYDPSAEYQDTGAVLAGVRVEGQMIVETAPTLANHVLRLADYSTTKIDVIEVANIANPTEISAVNGVLGKMLYAHESDLDNVYGTLYCWDPASTAVQGTPYTVVCTSGGKWVAMAGRYAAQYMSYGETGISAKNIILTGYSGDTPYSLQLISGVASLNKLTVPKNSNFNNEHGDNDFIVYGSHASVSYKAIFYDAGVADGGQFVIGESGTFPTRAIFYGSMDAYASLTCRKDVTVNYAAGTGNHFEVKQSVSGTLFFCDVTNNRVGIGTNIPAVGFHCVPAARFSELSVFMKGLTINSTYGGVNCDFQVNKETSPGVAFFVDAASGRVAVGKNTSMTYNFDVVGTSMFRGNALFNGEVYVNADAGDSDFRVYKTSAGNALWVNTLNSHTGINASPDPVVMLYVDGSIKCTEALETLTDLTALTGSIGSGFTANSTKGAYDFAVHGDTVDDVLKVTGSTNTLSIAGPVTLAAGVNIALATTTGTKIGTAANQKLGFFNVTPIVQQAHIANPTDLATSITAINSILVALETFGFLATV